MKEWVQEKKYLILIILAVVFIFIWYLQAKADPHEAAIGKGAPPIAETEEVKEESSSSDNGRILVDLKGEVKQPGVFSAKKDERVIDVIERAGGLTVKADSSQVNFAQKLEDEMVILIPEKGQAGDLGVIAGGPSEDGKININKADVNALQDIPGIGPSKAAAIIDYREKNGPFKKPEELKEISGIGDKTYEKLESAISVR